MSRRRRRIRNTLLLCSVPVLLASAWVVGRRLAGEDPYVAGQETEGIRRELERSLEEPIADFRFTDVTREAGIDFRHFPFDRTSQLPEDMGSGAAWGDYDGDGRDDLFLVNFAGPVGADLDAARRATDRLYRNRGDGTFEDVTEEAGLDVPHRGMGAWWGDFDGDGDEDLFVTAWGRNTLWRNEGSGTFTDVTEAAGLAEEGFWAGAAWGDYDRDGDLDLYVTGYVRYQPEDPDSPAHVAGDPRFPFTLNPSSYPPHPNRFYVNRGDGTFEERSVAAGIANPGGKGLGAVWADLDADDWPDLYVANDVSDNALYRNRGDGTFEDVSYEAVVADYRGAMGIAVADWDGDLDLDLFITHWIAQENALYSSLLSDVRSAGKEGSLRFVDEADRVGLGQIALDLIGWGAVFFDADSDGRLDLFVANGSTFQDGEDLSRLIPMHPHLYSNHGPDEGFYEVGEPAGIRTDPPGVGRGVAAADFDGDGDVDLVVTRNAGRARLLRNDSAGGRRIAFRLRGTRGHPAALGARLTLSAGGARHLRVVGGGASYLSQHSRELIVGLGPSETVDEVLVEWPGGGRDIWNDLPAGGRWLLVEGARPELLEPAFRGSKASGGRQRRTSSRSEHAVRSDVTTHLSHEEVRRFWELNARARGLLTDRRWEDAVAVLEEMIRLDPSHEDSLYSLGNARLELGRHEEALRAWEDLVRVNPAASRAWSQIGSVRSIPEAGVVFDLDAAQLAFDRAHELNPEHSGPLILGGEAALAAGRRDRAEELLSAAYRMNDQATSALYLAGYLARRRGDEHGGRQLLERAAASLEGEKPARGVLGEGDTREASVAEVRRAAASRRLFADCLEVLRARGADAEAVYGCVERRLRELARD